MDRRLSKAQLQILKEVAKGKTDNEIAKKLKFTPSGVNYHKQRLFLMFNVDNRTELAYMAAKEGLV